MRRWPINIPNDNLAIGEQLDLKADSLCSSWTDRETSVKGETEVCPRQNYEDEEFECKH